MRLKIFSPAPKLNYLNSENMSALNSDVLLTSIHANRQLHGSNSQSDTDSII